MDTRHFVEMFACIILFRSIPDAQVEVRCYAGAFQTVPESEETQKSLWLQR